MTNKQVTVYTGDECKESRQIINLLKELNIEYTEKNVSDNRDYLKELQAHDIYQTPVTFIEEKIILGYQHKKIQQSI